MKVKKIKEVVKHYKTQHAKIKVSSGTRQKIAHSKFFNKDIHIAEIVTQLFEWDTFEKLHEDSQIRLTALALLTTVEDTIKSFHDNLSDLVFYTPNKNVVDKDLQDEVIYLCCMDARVWLYNTFAHRAIDSKMVLNRVKKELNSDMVVCDMIGKNLLEVD